MGLRGTNMEIARREGTEESKGVIIVDLMIFI